MDVALCIEELVGTGAKYFGTTTDNTEECFNELTWNDERLKPTWEDILVCWESIKDREPPKTELELLNEEINLLKIRITQLEGL
jgi:hypothetical protein